MEPAAIRQILVVDDDVDMLRFLRETLQGLTHCHVDTSPNPEHGFELAIRKTYDLFIFDFSMPTMDGAVLYALLRKVYDLTLTPPRPLPPLVLMSGNAQQKRARELLNEPGVHGLLSKPFSIERLLQRVEGDTAGFVAPAMIFTPETRLQIKICGLTHPEDAMAAMALGADALGFNFYPGSKRALSVERDSQWIRALPDGVQKVAVTVNASRERIERILGSGAADSVQLHGEEDAAFCAELREAGIPFVKAIRVRDAASLDAVEEFGSAALLLDAFRTDAFGGTGQQMDWDLAQQFVRDHAGKFRVILSGGLNSDNVSEAIERVKPAGIDVASGVERTGDPRRKDVDQMLAFIANARRAESELKD